MSKPLIAMIVSLILALVAKVVGYQVVTAEEEAKIAEIVFEITALVSAYLHRPKKMA